MIIVKLVQMAKWSSQRLGNLSLESWRHYIILERNIMTLYLCTKTVTISSRGPPILSNFLFERQKNPTIFWIEKLPWLNKIFISINFFCNFFVDTGASLGLLMTFQSQVGSLSHTWRRCTCYTFPEIHLWCDTFAGV